MIGEEKKELRKKARNLRNKMTKAEIILWSRLRSRQISGHKFRRQQPIFDYIVDFYCHELKLIIEADGEIHFLREIQDADKKRDRLLKRNGYNILRFSNFEIETNLNATINMINSFISKISFPSQGDHMGSH